MLPKLSAITRCHYKKPKQATFRDHPSPSVVMKRDETDCFAQASADSCPATKISGCSMFSSSLSVPVTVWRAKTQKHDNVSHCFWNFPWLSLISRPNETAKIQTTRDFNVFEAFVTIYPSEWTNHEKGKGIVFTFSLWNLKPSLTVRHYHELSLTMKRADTIPRVCEHCRSTCLSFSFSGNRDF